MPQITFHSSPARIVSAGILIGLTGCTPTVSDKDIRTISLSGVRTYYVLQQRQPDDTIIVLIDPRTSAAYQAAHIPGARNMKLPGVWFYAGGLDEWARVYNVESAEPGDGS